MMSFQNQSNLQFNSNDGGVINEKKEEKIAAARQKVTI